MEAIREDKSVAQIATENSIHPNQIHKWKRQALEDFAQLFEDDRKGERAREAEHEKQINELYAEIGRLSAQLSWLTPALAGGAREKNLASNLSRAERLEMLEKNNPEMPLTSSRCPSGKHRQTCLGSVTRVCSMNLCRLLRGNWQSSGALMKSTPPAHFAAFKNHIGLYPTPSGTQAFKRDLSIYQGAKGSIKFPIDKPLPLKLISKIVKFRVAENLKNAEIKSSKRK